jgi:transcriptional regulator with XRE-family HTH domain
MLMSTRIFCYRWVGDTIRRNVAKTKDMLTEQVRARLATLRDETHISEAAIARTAGLVQQEVNRFFTGDMKLPRLDFMDAIARVFDRTLADVMAMDATKVERPEWQVRVLIALKAMEPTERHAFERLIDRPRAAGTARPRARRGNRKG